jgi:hypothetical protein
MRRGQCTNPPLGVIDADALATQNCPSPDVAAIRPTGESDATAPKVGTRLEVGRLPRDDAAMSETSHDENRECRDGAVTGRSKSHIGAERGFGCREFVFILKLRRRIEKADCDSRRTRNIPERQWHEVIPVAGTKVKKCGRVHDSKIMV